MIRIAEEEPEVGAEGPERDGDVPELPSPAMGVRAMERLRRKDLPRGRGGLQEAFEAGHEDGYGCGYVDGYDDGQYNLLVGLIRELESWVYERDMYPLIEGNWYNGVKDVIEDLRMRLEHEP